MKQSQSHRQDTPTTPTTPTGTATPTLSVPTKPTNKRPRKGSKEGTNEEIIGGVDGRGLRGGANGRGLRAIRV